MTYINWTDSVKSPCGLGHWIYSWVLLEHCSTHTQSLPIIKRFVWRGILRCFSPAPDVLCSVFRWVKLEHQLGELYQRTWHLHSIACPWCNPAAMYLKSLILFSSFPVQYMFEHILFSFSQTHCVSTLQSLSLSLSFFISNYSQVKKIESKVNRSVVHQVSVWLRNPRAAQADIAHQWFPQAASSAVCKHYWGLGGSSLVDTAVKLTMTRQQSC